MYVIYMVYYCPVYSTHVFGLGGGRRRYNLLVKIQLNFKKNKYFFLVFG